MAFIYITIGAISYFTNGTAFHYLALNPVSLILNQELWRLLTFSLVPSTIEGTLLFALVFWFIAPIVEDKFKTKKFIPLLLLVASLQGAVFTLLFWQKNINLAGGEGIAFFILTLYMLLEVSSEKIHFSLNKIHSLPFVVLLTVVWFSSVLIHHSFTENAYFNYAIIGGAYGIIFGTIIFMQIKTAEYLFGRKRQTKKPVNIPSPEELISSLSARKKTMPQSQFEDDFQEEETMFDDEEYFSEDRLNSILDKINEHGTESLTTDEKLYLEEYSKYL